MLRGAASALAVALAAALALAPAASAAPSRQQRAKARVALQQIVEDVDHTTAHRYGARDDRGAPLEGLKVVQVDGRYVGVYHAPGGGRFNVQVATSDDLIDWTRVRTLDEDAAQPTISVVPGGGLIVAYEKTTVLDLIPRAPLPPALTQIFDGPLDRIRVRFRFYRSLDALLAGQYSRQFTAPRTLSKTAEGTPSITKATLRRGLISRSRIEVRLHYFADVDHDGKPDVDRSATAVLSDFRRWDAQPDTERDDALLGLKAVHPGFSAPPQGSFGDRDEIVLDGVRLELQEAQYVRGDYASWRIFLFDPRSSVPRPLQILTDGASRSFGNPTVTLLTAPSGRPAVFVTMYVFSEGAAPGEAGPLIYYTER
ncbi:MAG: hypothetical protein QOJ35_2921 [Solirubrobacteraceae bacterium]|nr:hypothetical protein [Solirubrobacteraceae bacterium]